MAGWRRLQRPWDLRLLFRQVELTDTRHYVVLKIDRFILLVSGDLRLIISKSLNLLVVSQHSLFIFLSALEERALPLCFVWVLLLLAHLF